MMNYLWAGLIAISLLAALAQDIGDELSNRWRNGQRYSAQLSATDALGEATLSFRGDSKLQ